MDAVSLVAIDLAKNVVRLHGVGADGAMAFRAKLRRNQVLAGLNTRLDAPPSSDRRHPGSAMAHQPPGPRPIRRVILPGPRGALHLRGHRRTRRPQGPPRVRCRPRPAARVVPDGEVPAAPVGAGDQPGALGRAALAGGAGGRPARGRRARGRRWRCGSPASRRGAADEARPGGEAGEVARPQPVRRRGVACRFARSRGRGRALSGRWPAPACRVRRLAGPWPASAAPRREPCDAELLPTRPPPDLAPAESPPREPEALRARARSPRRIYRASTFLAGAGNQVG